MANIQPNSTIILLRNVPLDITYEHTIFFETLQAQESYFRGLTAYSFSNMSYVRKGRHSIKVSKPQTGGAYPNLYGCNYLMFKNTSFENKWFYAFITSVEYDNNESWVVNYMIDVMQTWYFDYTLRPCYIEREHSNTDNIGDNLVDEILATGDYVSDGIEHCETVEGDATTSYLRNLTLVFATVFNDDLTLTDFEGGYYAGLFSGLNFITFDLPPADATASEISQFVTSVTTFLNRISSTKYEGVVSCYVAPKTFVRTTDTTPTAQQFTKTIDFDSIYKDENGNNYKPHNNKLYTYPYNFLYCTNFQGTNIAYNYEYFTDPTQLIFEIVGTMNPDPEVLLAPMNYKGVTGTEPNYDERIILGGYPQIPYSTDVFKAWLAQSAGKSIVEAMVGIGAVGIGAGLSATGGGAVAGLPLISAGAGMLSVGSQGLLTGTTARASSRAPQLSAPQIYMANGTGYEVEDAVYKQLNSKETMNKVASLVGEGYKAQIAPRSAHQGSGGTILASLRLLDFGFMKKHIKFEYVKMIDTFFDMFGYATREVKIPNIFQANGFIRPHWSYIKTVGCCAVGSVPADDMAKICGIYDHGITFWKNGSEVGRYDLDNTLPTD